jgi:hypothetical protein
VAVIRRKRLKDLQQIFLFGGIYLKLFKLFFDRLLFLGLALFQPLDVELEFGWAKLVLFLEND